MNLSPKLLPFSTTICHQQVLLNIQQFIVENGENLSPKTATVVASVDEAIKTMMQQHQRLQQQEENCCNDC